MYLADLRKDSLELEIHTDAKGRRFISENITNKNSNSILQSPMWNAIQVAIQEMNIVKDIDSPKTYSENFQKNYSFEIRNIIEMKDFNSNEYIKSSQNWIGHIISINEVSFKAKLIDKSNPTTYEIADFDLTDIDEGDLTLLENGAVFYWSVAYGIIRRQVTKMSFLRFKRSIPLEIEEFDLIHENAHRVNNLLTWE